jgi:hypothetical protein
MRVADFAPMIFALSVVAIVYTSLVALAQEDMKKLIAYSSVAHMGIVTLGIFTFTVQGISGALFTMLSHGVVSGALFLCVGVLYDRVHSREIARYGGVAKIMPAYALVFMLFTMASVALPGTAGFPGELLVIVGAWKVNPWVALRRGARHDPRARLHALSLRRVAFGRITRTICAACSTCRPREYAVFAPLVVLDALDGRLSAILPLLLRGHGHRARRAARGRLGAARLAGGCDPMNWTLALPEIVLALSGLAILRHRRAARGATRIFPCCHGSRDRRAAPGRRRWCWRAGRHRLRRPVRLRRLRALRQGAGAARCGRGHRAALDFNAKEGLDRFEYPVLLLFATLGMMVMVSANDLMSLYIGLELLSLSLYVVAAFDRDNGTLGRGRA